MALTLGYGIQSRPFEWALTLAKIVADASNSPPFQGGDSIVKRPASDAGVVESAEHRQPPLHRSLDASKICPLLRKAGKFSAIFYKTR